MPDRIPESMSEYMAERISEYIYMCVCISTNVHNVLPHGMSETISEQGDRAGIARRM
jgi:hypothetical protein